MHDKDIYMLYISEAWGNGNQKGDVYGKKDWDQMPFKVRSFTAMAALGLDVSLPALWGTSVFDWCKKKRKGEKPQTTSPYNFARYQFLLDGTIKVLFIDLLIAKQTLQSL